MSVASYKFDTEKYSDASKEVLQDFYNLGCRREEGVAFFPSFLLPLRSIFPAPQFKIFWGLSKLS